MVSKCNYITYSARLCTLQGERGLAPRRASGLLTQRTQYPLLKKFSLKSIIVWPLYFEVSQH